MFAVPSLRLLLLPLIFCAGVLHANTIVQLATPLGNMKFELYDSVKPVTVANFLSYLINERYENTFAHRLPPGFVLQGGGFGLNEGGVFAVPTFAPIVNEAGPFPQYSNVFGTIAMAKTSDPNSATSQWFINLRDNSTSLDDPLNSGGFTVFGHIIEGAEVLDIFATFVNYSLYPDGTPGAANVVANAGPIFVPGVGNFPFTELPALAAYGAPKGPAQTPPDYHDVYVNDLIYTNWSIVSVPEPGTFGAILMGLCILGIGYRNIGARSHR